MASRKTGLGSIANAAKAAETAFAGSSSDERLAAAEERLAALETLQEDASKRELAGAELAEYIGELRGELRDLRKLRTVYGSLAVGLIAFLAFMLWALVFMTGSPLYTLPPYPAAVLVIALITGIALLTITLAKGVHRSSVERGKEDTTVDLPSLIVELAKKVGK